MAEQAPDTGGAQGGPQPVLVASASTETLNKEQQEQHTGAQDVTVQQEVMAQQHVTTAVEGQQEEGGSPQTGPANATEVMGDEPMEHDLQDQEGFSQHRDGGHDTSSGRETEDSGSYVGSDVSVSETEEQPVVTSETASRQGTRSRAPALSRPVTDEERQRFMHSAFTQTVLYPEQFMDGQPPDGVIYLADEVTGMPQHSYELRADMPSQGVERTSWTQRGPTDQRNKQGEEANRWGKVRLMVPNLGHRQWPRLYPEVTVPVTRLPHLEVTQQGLTDLFTAFLEAGLRCPVKGCEPWAALDAPSRQALPQPQAMLLRSQGKLPRMAEDHTKLDPLVVCGPANAAKCKDRGHKGLDAIFEHWVHFHMHEGRCFVAPCCTREAIPATSQCKDRTFSSVSAAAEHLLKVHRKEMEDKRRELRAVNDRQESAGRRRSRGQQHNRPAGYIDLGAVEFSDLSTIAQYVVRERMQLYDESIRVLRILGRRRWFSHSMLTRALVGFHLRQFDHRAQGWNSDHVRWLEHCKTAWIAWTVNLESYSAAPAPLKAGYSAAAKTPAGAATTGTGPRKGVGSTNRVGSK